MSNPFSNWPTAFVAHKEPKRISLIETNFWVKLIPDDQRHNDLPRQKQEAVQTMKHKIRQLLLAKLDEMWDYYENVCGVGYVGEAYDDPKEGLNGFVDYWRAQLRRF